MKYLIAFEIETSLSAGEDYTFQYKGIKIRLVLGGNKKICYVESKAENGRDAVANVAPIISESLGVISYITKASTFLMDPLFVLKSEKGKEERSVYLVTNEVRKRGPSLIKLSANSSQDLLDRIDDKSELTLRWLRWSFRATTWLEKFVFLWLSMERVVGQSMQYAQCTHGHEIKKCPECDRNLNKYTSVNKDKVKEILRLIPEHKQLDFDRLWRARNSVFHGRGAVDISEIATITPNLQESLLLYIDDKLKPQYKLDINPVQKTTVFKTHTIFNFKTSMIGEEFAMDYPGEDEVRAYLHNPNGNFSFYIPSGDLDYDKW